MNYRLQKFANTDLVLARSAAERDKINRSLTQLESVLRYRLNGIKEIIRFGSYTRNTILPRKYDIRSYLDLLIVFEGNLTSETYRRQLINAVSSAYPNSISKKDYPAIKLELNHIMFDLVPARKEISSWSGDKYYIPNRHNGWQQTIPNDLNNALSQKNQYVGDNVIRQVIRLCKHWNASAGYPLSSYLMEKDIVSLWYFGHENLYDRFLKTLNSIAGERSDVNTAIRNIKNNQEDFWGNTNKDEQLRWLQRLLPGLK